jgi:hypothetical protein
MRRLAARRALPLIAAALLGAAVAPAAAQETPAPGDVVVNEILYDPPPESDSGEYVELLNRSDRALDLSSLALADSRDEPVPVTSEPQTLAPGEYAVLVQDGEAFAAVFPEIAFIEPGSWPQLNNGGDTAQLLAGGVVIDAVPYEPGWGGADVALERIDPAGPSGEASNFGNAEAEVGTPGAENTLFAGGPDTNPPALDSVAVAASRAALTAVFSEPLAPASVAASAFSIEAETGDAPTVTAASPAENDPAQVELALSGALASGEHTLVAGGVADESGNALGEGSAAFAVAPGSVPDPRSVVVNELWYAPENAALEFVEVSNRTDEPFDLGAFRLADARREETVIAEETMLLGPREYAVMVRDSTAFAERFPDTDFVEVAPWPALNNGGDAAVLFFGSQEARIQIDAVPYEPSWGGSDTTSLERVDPAGPSASATNFASSTAPAEATPGAQNAVFRRDTAAPRPVFGREVRGEESTFAVTFSEPLDSASVAPSDFALGGASPDSARAAEDRKRVRLVFGDAPGGQTLTARGVADLTGNALGEASVSVAFVAEPFAERPPGELVVNEILYDPLSGDFDNRPNQPEYVELFNPTDRRLALEGYFLTDRPDEDGEFDRVALGRERASIAPGGYAVAYAAGDASLAEAFPETNVADSSDITLLPVDRASLGLPNGGGLVALRRPGGALLDSVFYRPEWQSEAVESGDGRALERIAPTGPSSRASNWQTATAESGGTPGRPNGNAPPPENAPSAGIEVTPSPFSPDGDGIDDVAFIRYALEAPVSLARVRIYDSMGREVYEREAELAGREGQIAWQGRSEEGERLNVGIYVVLFEALDADGGSVETFREPVVLARPLE